jgi:hypothetical protein
MLDEISRGRVQSINGIMHRQPSYSATPFPFVQIDYDEFSHLLARGLVSWRHDRIELTPAGEKHRISRHVDGQL